MFIRLATERGLKCAILKNTLFRESENLIFKSTYFAKATSYNNIFTFLSFLMGHPWPLLRLFSSVQTKITIFTMNVQNVHPVYDAGIRTHNLWNLSLLP